MKNQSSTYSAKSFTSPSNMMETFNSQLKSPSFNQIPAKKKEQPQNSSYGHISSVRTQLSLEKKKVQDLNKVVMDYQHLKQGSETKLNASLDELRSYRDELSKSQKENKNYQYKLEYLEKEKIRLENQNRQLKSYITKLEASLKAAQQRRGSNNSPFNRTQNSASNINQTFSHENFNSNNTNTLPQQNISSQNLNVSNISQSINSPNPQQSYVKKLEADVKNYQQEIKILTSALEINSPKVSIKRGLDQSLEQQHEKSLIQLTKELAECKEMIQQTEDVETSLREKIQSLNQELEKAIIQIEEHKIIKDNDNEEIFKLENENKQLKVQITEFQQSQQILQNQMSQNLSQNQSISQLQSQSQQQQQHLQQMLMSVTERQNTPKQSQIEMKLQSSFQQHLPPMQQQNDYRVHNNSSHLNQIQSVQEMNEAYEIIEKQKETIRDLTEQNSQIKAQLTEQNLNAYSDQQKWNKQFDDLQSTVRVKEERSLEVHLKIKELQLEIDSLKMKIEQSKEKKKKFKQEIHILKTDQKQLDSFNQKLNIKLKQVIEESSGFKDLIFSALKLNSKNYQVPRSAEVVIEEILYLKSENKHMKQALDESVNKYAQQVMLNKDLKVEIKSKESQMERQAESKTLVQSTLASQIYNLRSQNTDLQEINSTIRRECAMFMDSLKQTKTKKGKRSKSLKKSKSNKSLKN